MLIKNEKYGVCVALPGKGKGRPDGRVQDDPGCEASGSDNQRWTLKPGLKDRGRGTGGADLDLIRNVTDGLCLDLSYYGPARSATPVTEYHCDGSDEDNQLWRFDQRPGGMYWIRNQKSDEVPPLRGCG
ncbi:RICIN domain-containing protein [Streptomyces sp. NPDC005962]|uniref:RICIN domain-containing protein n=1 Tax=Streptomyces sp. NPDC005962 TaxID=3154466 RepID=UPI0033C68937